MATIQQIANRLGKMLDASVTIGTSTFSGEDIISIKPGFDGQILTSVMREAEIELDAGDAETALAMKGQEVSISLTLAEGEDDATKTFETLVVYDAEFDEDSASMRLQCYDKTLYAMIPYELEEEYPVALGQYLKDVCEACGVPHPVSVQVFSNSTLEIDAEKFDSSYTYRDVLTQIAQAAGGTLAIKNGVLTMLYPSASGVELDIDNAMDIVVGEEYGPVNVVVLARTPQEDNIYYPSVLPENPFEIRIEDNQIVDTDRDAWIPGIYAALNGLSYRCFSYESFGELCLDICDEFTFHDLDGNDYTGLCLYSFAEIGQGLKEDFVAEPPSESQATDYTAASSTDKGLRRVNLRVDKQENRITAEVAERQSADEELASSIQQTATDLTISITRALEDGLSDKVDQEQYDREVGTKFVFSENGLDIHSAAGSDEYLHLQNDEIDFMASGTSQMKLSQSGIDAQGEITAHKGIRNTDGTHSYVWKVINGKLTLLRG